MNEEMQNPDGTLVTKDKVLTAAAKAAARELYNAGIALAVTSGRPPRGMSMLIEPLALQGAIAGFNGGVFANPDLSVIESHTLDPATATQTLNLILDRGLDAWLEGNSRSPQEAMVTGDCGGVREHGTFGNGSIEEPERSTVVSARSGNERSMLDEWNIPEKGKRCSGSRIRW
jgi:hypothetical protein